MVQRAHGILAVRAGGSRRALAWEGQLKRSILCGLVAAMPLSACSPGHGDVLSQEGTFTVAVMPAELTLEARGMAAVAVAIASLKGVSAAVQASATPPAGISAC